MSLARLHLAAGISRQAFHKKEGTKVSLRPITPYPIVLEMAQKVRKEYLPGSGAREVYFYIRHKHPHFNELLVGWGKHRFEAFCLCNGMRVESRRWIPKTTFRGDYIFPNRIEGLQLTDIDQVWVSDICYIFDSHGKLLGYATSLIDLYSRRLLGLSFSQTMRAEETSRAVISQAYAERDKSTFEGLFFHSDAGRQYSESLFIDVLRKRKIQSSMAANCYENAFAEAFNDTLKNHMINGINLNSFLQLKDLEGFLKDCYNCNKPHSSLNRLTPVEFENALLSVQPCQRTILKIKKIEQRSANFDHLISTNLS